MTDPADAPREASRVRSPISTRLGLIRRAALDLFEVLDRDGDAWEAHRTCDLEEDFAPKVIALADALATIGPR